MAIKVRHQKTCEIFVMKQIRINSSDPGDLNSKLMECHVQTKIRHPNVIRYKDHFVDEQMLCILFEYCE